MYEVCKGRHVRLKLAQAASYAMRGGHTIRLCSLCVPTSFPNLPCLMYTRGRSNLSIEIVHSKVEECAEKPWQNWTKYNCALLAVIQKLCLKLAWRAAQFLSSEQLCRLSFSQNYLRYQPKEGASDRFQVTSRQAHSCSIKHSCLRLATTI